MRDRLCDTVYARPSMPLGVDRSPRLKELAPSGRRWRDPHHWPVRGERDKARQAHSETSITSAFYGGSSLRICQAPVSGKCFPDVPEMLFRTGTAGGAQQPKRR
jgi:hypothetical protein